jgi:hypothetical protein
MSKPPSLPQNPSPEELEENLRRKVAFYWSVVG